MEVYKKINNNVALARDAKGREPCFWRRTISPIQPGKNWIAP